MANVLVENSSLEDIADAIRSKIGTQTKYKPSEMADAISAISGGGITPTGTKTINLTQNGTTTEDVTIYANAQVNVNVPSVTPTGTKQVSITQNGTTTEDVTNYASAEITANVPNSYSASDEGKVVDNGELVSQTSQNVTENGTYDTTTNDEVVVSVPNSYSASDEGKVVSSGALVSQTSRAVTSNGTIDTTLNNSVEINVPQGITPTGSQTFTQNGTYDVTNLAEAVVNVASSGGGVHTEEGYVELSDTTVGNSPALNIPVDLTSAQGFILNLYVVETGEVSGGVVTKYDHIEIPTAFADNSHNFVWNYMLKYPQNPAPVVYRDATNLSSITRCSNASYTHAKRSSNGAQVPVDLNPTINSSGVTLTTMNGTRFFCVAGAYAKFKYEITWW